MSYAHILGTMYEYSSCMIFLLSCMINVDHSLYHDPYPGEPPCDRGESDLHRNHRQKLLGVQGGVQDADRQVSSFSPVEAEKRRGCLFHDGQNQGEFSWS